MLSRKGNALPYVIMAIMVVAVIMVARSQIKESPPTGSTIQSGGPVKRSSATEVYRKLRGGQLVDNDEFDQYFGGMERAGSAAQVADELGINVNEVNSQIAKVKTFKISPDSPYLAPAASLPSRAPKEIKDGAIVFGEINLPMNRSRPTTRFTPTKDFDDYSIINSGYDDDSYIRPWSTPQQPTTAPSTNK